MKNGELGKFLSEMKPLLDKYNLKIDYNNRDCTTGKIDLKLSDKTLCEERGDRHG